MQEGGVKESRERGSQRWRGKKNKVDRALHSLGLLPLCLKYVGKRKKGKIRGGMGTQTRRRRHTSAKAA